jgi:hypothetical protein
MEIAAESRFGVGQAQHWPAETRSAYRAVDLNAAGKRHGEFVLGRAENYLVSFVSATLEHIY